MNPIAIVTGGTSGIGLATANALRDSGARVYVLSRREADLPGLEHMICDVSDEAAVRETVKEIVAREGRIDILVNNAGFGISGAAEFTENADAKKLMDVNLFGAVNMTKAVLAPMRAQGRGRIVNISAVAAPLPIPFQAWYSVSKAAISAYTVAVFNEVKQFGVSVCAIMPGDIHTGFTAAREKSAAGDDVYTGRIARSVTKMERDEETGMDPAVAGRYIAKIARKKRVKPLYAIGLEYKFFVLLSRILPIRTIGWLLGLLYSMRCCARSSPSAAI